MKKAVVFLFEANSQSKSDYYYVRSVLKTFYDSRVILEKIFCGSKCELYSNSTKTKIKNAIKKHPDADQYFYVFFADVDTGTNADKERNKKIEEFSATYGENASIVWFNPYIEDLFLGKKVPDKDKAKMARQFFSTCTKSDFDETKLSYNKPLTKLHSSNILLIFNKIFSKLK